MHQKSSTPRIIKSNEDFVIVRLSTGESILAIRLKEDEKEITIEYPFALKNYPRITKQGGIIEQVTAGPYCSFAENRVFTFPKKDVFFIKKLHSFAIPFFMSLYNQHERLVAMGSYEDLMDRFMDKQEMADLRHDEQFPDPESEEYTSNYDTETEELTTEEIDGIREIYNQIKNKDKKVIH
jgi:hypothetical protein